MLSNVRISFKLLMVSAISILSIVVVATVGLVKLRDTMLEDRKTKLESLVLLARQAVQRDYEGSVERGLTIEQAASQGRTLLKSLRFGDDYFFALDQAGYMRVHPNAKLEDTYMGQTADSGGIAFVRQQIDAGLKGGGFVSYRFSRPQAAQPSPKISFNVDFKPYGWIIASGIYVDDVDPVFWSEVRWTGAVIATVLLMVVSLSVLLGRSIVGPIAHMTEAMRRLAKGETDTSVPALERGDEVGAMAKSVQVLKEIMVESDRLRAEQDVIKSQSEIEKKRMLSNLADEFETGVRDSLENLGRSSTTMRSMSEDLSATAQEASERASTVAAAAKQTTTSVQSVAAEAEELAVSVAEIGRQTVQSRQIAGDAVDQAEATNRAVQDLSSVAHKIGDIVQFISDFAGQTNLLALNATIEAGCDGSHCAALRSSRALRRAIARANTVLSLLARASTNAPWIPSTISSARSSALAGLQPSRTRASRSEAIHWPK
ncbi:cache domain-containing protein [Bradyrhizobium sp. AUGA SZCCT0051]|nr:cache domain-containing protein [Bradyrhizobium sp. AUGA SZCCT0124]MBR1314444.1 cache domain-containing protein [Bradyrhizobium sp. AUGA SZCCT0051]MBR1342538.1 cache domain-containing protein [Bradyrhizobium sp. AUGA SZCCT0105]MBR1352768.1 cache domain-containing protein [Bradyrhizobium sp. AUGA SZCCT0045]